MVSYKIIFISESYTPSLRYLCALLVSTIVLKLTPMHTVKFKEVASTTSLNVIALAVFENMCTQKRWVKL